jgi:hypothetical protein
MPVAVSVESLRSYTADIDNGLRHQTKISRVWRGLCYRELRLGEPWSVPFTSAPLTSRWARRGGPSPSHHGAHTLGLRSIGVF